MHSDNFLAWFIKAREGFLHPYIAAFLYKYPHQWHEKELPQWDQLTKLMEEMDAGEVGIDSEPVFLPLLISTVGPTNGLMFFQFCQEILDGFPVDSILEGQWNGCSMDGEKNIPLAETGIWVTYQVLNLLDTSGEPVENWPKLLGDSGVSKINNFWKWASLYLDNPQYIQLLLVYGPPVLREKFTKLIQLDLKFLSVEKAFKELKKKLN